MFVKAYEIASKYTSPVVISMRHFDNTVICNIGAFVLLNNDGWIITVAHILNSLFAFNEHKNEIKEYEKNKDQITNNENLSGKQKRKKIAKLSMNPKWITNHSFWWGDDRFLINEFKIFQEGDIAIGRIKNYKDPGEFQYPTFIEPQKMKQGTSLCKLGYPFYKVNASFDDKNQSFILAPGTLPIPRFPIEGIFTRNVNIGKSKDNKYEIKLIETSSPGLRGQSGGPIFDVNGFIWGIQSRTQHFPLGFSPKILKDNKEFVENQFLNVGLGVHTELIIEFLNNNGIKTNRSD